MSETGHSNGHYCAGFVLVGLFRRPHYWCTVHPLPWGAATGTCRGPEFLAAASKPSAGIAPKSTDAFLAGVSSTRTSRAFAHATILGMVREESHESPILCCVCDARGLRTWRGRGSGASRPSQTARLPRGRNRYVGPGSVFEELRSKGPGRVQAGCRKIPFRRS